jgi:hypothetical protein
MPELTEFEVIQEVLSRRIFGQIIASAEIIRRAALSRSPARSCP